MDSKIIQPPTTQIIQSSLNAHQNMAQTISIKQSLIAGGLARIIAQSTLHPLDSMRTHAQLRMKDPNLPFIPSNPFKGIVPQIIFSGPAGALQFSVLEVLFTPLPLAFDFY
jgi:hypothetical protein